METYTVLLGFQLSVQILRGSSPPCDATASASVAVVEASNTKTNSLRSGLIAMKNYTAIPAALTYGYSSLFRRQRGAPVSVSLK